MRSRDEKPQRESDDDHGDCALDSAGSDQAEVSDFAREGASDEDAQQRKSQRDADLQMREQLDAENVGDLRAEEKSDGYEHHGGGHCGPQAERRTALQEWGEPRQAEPRQQRSRGKAELTVDRIGAPQLARA